MCYRADYDKVKELCHSLDYTIDIGGNVVGMALSPDHRWAFNVHSSAIEFLLKY